MARARFAVPATRASGEQYAASTPSRRAGARRRGTRSRAGIRVYLDVGEGGEQAERLPDREPAGRSYADGRADGHREVRNTGARALDLSVSCALRNGPGRLSAGPFPVTRGTTLGVGQTAPVRITLPSRSPVVPGPLT